MATTITLPRSIYDEIITHALEGAPEEICGILGGLDGVASELVRGRNEATNRIMDVKWRCFFQSTPVTPHHPPAN